MLLIEFFSMLRSIHSVMSFKFAKNNTKQWLTHHSIVFILHSFSYLQIFSSLEILVQIRNYDSKAEYIQYFNKPPMFLGA